MIYEFSNYRHYLKNVLVDRNRKNPSYSMRAFAQQLDLAPSTLSEVLKEKKNLSYETSLKVAKGINLNVKETEYFTTLVQIELNKDLEIRDSLKKRLDLLIPRKKATNVELDIFRLIADWYHYTILEIITIQNLNFSFQDFAKALGITKLEVETAFERIERLNLAHKDEKGRWCKTQEDLLVESIIPSEALRLYHKQMLSKAIESLQTQSPQEKFVGSETFAFDSNQMEDAKAIMEECFDRLVKLSKKSSKKDSVYHIGIQFFKLFDKNKKDQS